MSNCLCVSALIYIAYDIQMRAEHWYIQNEPTVLLT